MLILVNSKGQTIATLAEASDIPNQPTPPTPTPTPTPPSGIAPPPQAAAQGFTSLIKAMSDEFTAAPDIGFGTNGHKWNSNLWYEQPADPSQYSWDGKSVLTMDASKGNVSLCTMSHDASQVAAQQFGYFECYAALSNWSGPWLFSVAHARNQGGQCSEIDIMEFDNSTPTQAHQTLHRDTGGNDAWNQGKGDNQWNPAEIGNALRTFRKYGVLWLPTAVTFYVDDKETATMPPYASTAQPMFLIMDIWQGALLGGPEAPPLTAQFDWVRSWGPAP